MSIIMVLMLRLVHFHAVDASKLRTWLDSSRFMLDGNLPSPRFGHGLATTEDNKMYVFGGQGENGKLWSCAYELEMRVVAWCAHNVSCILLCILRDKCGRMFKGAQAENKNLFPTA